VSPATADSRRRRPNKLQDVASTSRATKRPKPTRAEKRELRSARRTKRRETFRNLRQAFTLTRQKDPKFLPLFISAIVIAVAVVYVVVFLVTGSPYLPIPLALIVGFLAAMLVFSRRAQRSMFAQAEGQAGAAGWMLQQQLRGDWRLTQAVAGTTQLDVVHRLVGRPGVVLVGEGASHRVRGLLAQEKKRTARVVGDTPIYDITVGTGEGDVRLSRLNRYLLKLPANLSKEQVGAVEKRLSALGGTRAGMPQGPVPQGAKIRNVQRTVRRRS
jgi:F0F1-type ATP synthase assembly protein I